MDFPEYSEAREVVGKAMRFLNKRDREIIRLYYFDELTDDSISKKLHLSREVVTKLRLTAITSMRERLGVA